MLDRIKTFLDRRSPMEVIAIALALLVLIGALDHLTGFMLSFSLFYLLPIALVTWYTRRWAGFALCGISTGVWFLADSTAGHPYAHWTIPIWNAATRLGFFITSAYLLGRLKTNLRQEEFWAKTDGLTRVLNARAFKEVASRLLQIAGRYGHPVALAYIDLDDFKAVNDEKGHSAGDMVLQKVAGVLAQRVRSADIVGRLGGDEFAVLMPETGHAGAQSAFREIHRELMEYTLTEGLPIGFSIGVAAFRTAPLSIEEALKIADHLMYRVKKAGKNNVMCEEYGRAEMET